MREGILVCDKRGGRDKKGVRFQDLPLNALFEADGKIFWKSDHDVAHVIQSGPGVTRWADCAFQNLQCLVRPDLMLTLTLESREQQ